MKKKIGIILVAIVLIFAALAYKKQVQADNEVLTGGLLGTAVGGAFGGRTGALAGLGAGLFAGGISKAAKSNKKRKRRRQEDEEFGDDFGQGDTHYNEDDTRNSRNSYRKFNYHD